MRSPEGQHRKGRGGRQVQAVMPGRRNQEEGMVKILPVGC